MYKDPVVEELRENARKLFEECGNDLHEIIKRLRQEQSNQPQRIIRRRELRPPASGTTPSGENPKPAT